MPNDELRRAKIANLLQRYNRLMDKLVQDQSAAYAKAMQIHREIHSDALRSKIDGMI